MMEPTKKLKKTFIRGGGREKKRIELREDLQKSEFGQRVCENLAKPQSKPKVQN